MCAAGTHRDGVSAEEPAMTEQPEPESERARAELGAVREVLRIISRGPHDLEAVLDTIALAAMRLCDADGVNISRLDGDATINLAPHGLIPEQNRGVRRPP